MRLLKRFVHYYKPYKGAFFMDMFCVTLVSAVDLSVPLIINYLVRSVYILSDTALLTRIAVQVLVLMGALYVVRYFGQFYITSWGHIMGARMESDMRSDLFSHMEKLSFSYYDKNNTGKMMSRIISDLFDICELAHHGPEDIFISLVKLVGAFIILVNINIPVTLILLAVTVIMLVFSLYYNKLMEKVFLDNRRKIADVNAIVQDSLSGIRTVKSFSNEDVEQSKFEEGNHEFLLSKKANYMMLGCYFSFNSLLQGVMYLAVLQNLSLSISAGRNVALVGPSGAGKTTFCSLVPRFYDVTGGAVSVDGKDVRDVTMQSLRRNIGVVQQEVYIFNTSVRENIAYGRPDATDEEIIEAAKKANIHDFILSLEDGISERGSHEDLLQRQGLYSRLYNMQFEGLLN